MKPKYTVTILLGCLMLIVSSLVIAQEAREPVDRRPDREPVIAKGSPHRSPQLLGLPHIELADAQKTRIETIVENNQDGVREVHRALREAEKTLAEAKQTGRPKRIKAAAAHLGEAIAEKAILDVSVVDKIKHVLTERQLAKLEDFNARSRRWLAQGKLTESDKPARDAKTE